MVCKILHSSGDAILDTRMCDVAVTCVPPDVTNAQQDQVRACLEPRGRAVIAARAAERRAARLRG